MQHDACGVGFIARLDADGGGAGHDIVEHGLTALVRLAHRGAPASLGAVDGCGLLTAIPWELINRAFGARMPQGRTCGLGMIFVPPARRDAAIAIVERELRAAGASVAWRTVPVDRAAVLPAQRATTPAILQVLAAVPDGRRRAEELLYRVRLRIERAAALEQVPLSIASLSTTTVVYKALVPPEALPRFFPDLASDRFASRFVVFHQRFSTNTSADWALAQPFRALAHNGEINTIGGNRAWMRARTLDASSLPGFTAEPPVSSAGSDSASLDDAVELLRHQGYPIAHALSRLMPPAWERDRDLAPDVRAFHEFQSLVSEPWDGPSAVAFADGRFVGAALDRNGFRPARIVRTAGNLIAVASEVGVLSAAEHEIVDRDRLGPGEIVMVDLERGAVMRTNDIHRRLAFKRRYRAMVASTVRTLAEASIAGSDRGDAGSDRGDAGSDRGDAGSKRTRPTPNGTRPSAMGRVPPDPTNLPATVGRVLSDPAQRAHLPRLQAAFGCTREEIELLLKPMSANAHEAVGSMGDDAPPAVLSRRPRLFTDFFRQRFAQVTNPPIDPYRESQVMSLTTLLGAHGSYVDELARRPVRIGLRSPVLTRDQMRRLLTASELSPATIATVFDPTAGTEEFERRLDAIAAEACEAVARGSAMLVLSDREVAEDRAPIPALLATAAVHRALVERGLRMRASLVVDTGDARDAHQLAAIVAFGASAVCPWLGYETIDASAAPDPTGCEGPAVRYRLALERGLLTIMSKMGVCTAASYCGAQLFEILGLGPSIAVRFFADTPSAVGGVGLDEIASAAIDRHRRAFSAVDTLLDYPGLHGYRRDGEYHATNPLVVRGLQKSIEDAAAYDTFKAHVHNRPATAVRDLLEFVPGDAIALHRVESADDICRRFFASAMSVGALSPEAHRTVARAMNMLGARSNSGEGGEEPDRFERPADGDFSSWEGSRTKQVASARFGVTPAYLRSADELQIKIAQGSKPGEGGQLPAIKVVPHIARLRHAQPGTTLISPPVHHDIYSIEDLAQLIHDLRAFHPAARINVKLVASAGVGIIATGVAKAGADAIQISGHDGGTGASPRGSIKHAGLPWEIGLAEAHDALSAVGLRGRVVLQTDGGLKTGRDVAMAAAPGADEYGFGTAALVAIGCVMARQCHANTCPVGIATQRDDLRDAFSGTAEMLVGYLRLVAGEVREILASLGLRTVGDLVGRNDLLRRRPDVASPLDLSLLLRGRTRVRPGSDPGPTPKNKVRRQNEIGDRRPLQPVLAGPISNTDRAFGADVAGMIAAQFGDAGLPAGSVSMTMTGSAGQSFGAFALPGMRLALVGDANDGLGKAMHGGEITVSPGARERGRTGQVLVGNAALYGATGGRAFIAGRAGERFAVRNSGATAVVEGLGDHGCEYMTGGIVAVLGPVGRNFASGMTGGVAYVSDRRQTLASLVNHEQLSVEPLSAADRKALRELIETHERLTGSRLARAILRNDRELTTFKRVSARSMIAGLGDQACTSPREKSTSCSSTPPASWPESAALAG